jgi:ribosomal protein S18 acetylase RimI-like enzyme
MSDVSIERITYVDEAVMEAASRLSLQLDSSNQVTITEDYLETIILNPDSFWLMAKRNARRMPTNVRSFLENVVVGEDSRGKGIGLALCSEAFAIADSQGANTLRTQAGTHNAASRAMLQKAGFKIEDYLDYYEINIHDGPRF